MLGKNLVMNSVLLLEIIPVPPCRTEFGPFLYVIRTRSLVHEPVHRAAHMRSVGESRGWAMTLVLTSPRQSLCLQASIEIDSGH